MLDLSVHLRKRFFAAHREDGVAEGDHYAEQSELLGEVQPPVADIAGMSEPA